MDSLVASDLLCNLYMPEQFLSFRMMLLEVAVSSLSVVHLAAVRLLAVYPYLAEYQ